MSQTIDHPWKNGGDDSSKPEVLILPSRHIQIIADGDTDADGSPDADVIDKCGQLQTALGRDNGWKGDGKYVNARVIPYFVLPSNWADVTGIRCGLGDVAKISYQGKTVYAVYADVGPDDLIGELSIAAVEALGHNPWNRERTSIETGISHGVRYEIIPGSASLAQTVTFETVQAYGKAMFGDTAQADASGDQGAVTWFEFNQAEDGRPVITAYAGPAPKYTRYVTTKESVIGFLQAFPNARNVLVAKGKPVPSCPDYAKPKPQISTAKKFVGFFESNYAAVRGEVERWFIDDDPEPWSENAIKNGCVAHQVSCLHLCQLPHPALDTVPSVNVDAFVAWALNNGWSKILEMQKLQPGDICVSGPSASDLDHVYCFVDYIDDENAHVLHNQVFGLASRSLVGNGCGTWRFALRMPG